MDDLQISYRHPDWRTVQRKLRDKMYIVEKFAQKNGFKFTLRKTSMLHFTKLSRSPPIELWLGNISIKKSETVEYLSLMLDSKLDWKAHIQQLESKCNKTLNFMQNVSSTKWGADQKTLTMIYRFLIISKIDYGCIVYNSASSREPVNLASIRWCKEKSLKLNPHSSKGLSP